MKKLHSFSLSQETALKLEMICKKKNIKKTNFIEFLIENHNDEYELTNNSIDLDQITNHVLSKIKEKL